MSNDIQAQLAHALENTHLDIGEKYEGKVRDVYKKGGKMAIIATDRVSAFDKVLGTIPFRGQVLTQMAQFWFDQTKDIMSNHVLQVPAPNVMIVAECEPVMVEFVVRGYITGNSSTSLWKTYSEGRDPYGLNLPAGLKKHQKLAEPVITPTTKAEQGEHDAPITPEEIVRRGLLTKDEYDELARKTTQLYKRGAEFAAKNGMILVDTKYEFGKLNGEFVVIDEIHTPDSSRYWYADSYVEGEEPKALDKEFIRQWLLDQGFSGDGEPPALPDEIRIEAARRYIETYEKITGAQFEGAVGSATWLNQVTL